eukprot:gene5082-7089_t
MALSSLLGVKLTSQSSKKEEDEVVTFLWERNEDVEDCRTCKHKFTSFKRRHHCRNCGGIYCEDCCDSNVPLKAELLSRCCHGCRRGEAPGLDIRNIIERKFTSSPPPPIIIPSVVIPVTYGSLYEPGAADSAKGSSGTSESPACGYFEFTNKTSTFCCIKLMIRTKQGNTLWEIPRPSYTAIPPGEVVSATFDPTIDELELVLLGNNPFPLAEGDSISYNTKGPIKVSESAVIENFRDFVSFRIATKHRNLLLKYKGDGIVLPRQGNSVARVGIFNKLMGTKTPLPDASSVNYSTNIDMDAITVLYTSIL